MDTPTRSPAVSDDTSRWPGVVVLIHWLTVLIVLVADRSGSARQRPPPHKRNVNYKQATVDTAVDGADALEEVRLFS